MHGGVTDADMRQLACGRMLGGLYAAWYGDCQMLVAQIPKSSG